MTSETGFPEILSFSAIRQRLGVHAPLVLCASQGETRELALGRLACESIGGGGKVLWVRTARRTDPLAWVRLRHLFLDCSHVGSWPAVSPLDWEASHATQWFAYASGIASRSDRAHLAEATGRVLGTASFPSYRAAVEQVRVRYQASRDSSTASSDDRWDGAAHDAPGDHTGIDFSDLDLVVIRGGARDFQAATSHVLCVLGAFVTQARLHGRGEPWLLILEGAFDQWPPLARSFARAVIVDHVRGRDPAVLASTDPATWDSDLAGLSLLDAAIPLVSDDFSGSWPEVWDDRLAGRMQGAALARSVAVPNGAQWDWLSCPSPFDAPIRGVSVIDEIEDGS